MFHITKGAVRRPPAPRPAVFFCFVSAPADQSPVQYFRIGTQHGDHQPAIMLNFKIHFPIASRAQYGLWACPRQNFPADGTAEHHPHQLIRRRRRRRRRRGRRQERERRGCGYDSQRSVLKSLLGKMLRNGVKHDLDKPGHFVDIFDHSFPPASHVTNSCPAENFFVWLHDFLPYKKLTFIIP